MPKLWFVLVLSVALGDLYVTTQAVSHQRESGTRVTSAASGNVRRPQPPVRRVRSNGDGLTPPWPIAQPPVRP